MGALPIYKIMFGVSGLIGVSSGGVGILSSNSKLNPFAPKCRVFYVTGDSGNEKFFETTISNLEGGDYGKNKDFINKVKEECDNSNLPERKRWIYVKLESDGWTGTVYSESDREAFRKKHTSS